MSSIKSISFLFDGERVVVESNESGKFSLPATRTIRGRLKTSDKDHTAIQVVTHGSVRSSDPVLTLNSGEKLRVYQGGDKTCMLTVPASIIEKHDAKFLLKERLAKKYLHSNPFEFPYEDLGDWD
jgi:hypothetical protein